MEAGAGLGDGVPRPGRLAILAVVLGAVVVGVAVGVGAHLVSASHTSSPAARPSTGLDGEATWAAGQTAAPAIDTLHDQNGHLFSLASLHGRPVALEFFDSHCKQECPLAGRALAAAERGVAPAQRPVLVVVSVNPLDTPASTRAAIRSWGLAGVAQWYWLRGTHAQLAPVWSAYHIFVKPMRGDISHTEALYLIDRRGYERSGYLYPYIPFRVAHDMRMLAAQRASGVARGAA
jgi:cytochrome oxidase Cu insertion factor (SCO1/SenC/PrrC family)